MFVWRYNRYLIFFLKLYYCYYFLLSFSRTFHMCYMSIICQWMPLFTNHTLNRLCSVTLYSTYWSLIYLIVFPICDYLFFLRMFCHFYCFLLKKQTRLNIMWISLRILLLMNWIFYERISCTKLKVILCNHYQYDIKI